MSLRFMTLMRMFLYNDFLRLLCPVNLRFSRFSIYTRFCWAENPFDLCNWTSNHLREYDGGQFFLSFIQWTDCHLAGPLGLPTILIHKEADAECGLLSEDFCRPRESDYEGDANVAIVTSSPVLARK
ncbi:hypothetical protein L2E82_17001 [Cichorium intybus]|uniref:Uncharacterized protein n=1 Tax=Cichorium intybus TaxID=13427 RepID=A0ACB9F736_CICIN|nr:hypothetical protein L2E82_17001 [Cichorium intybus]